MESISQETLILRQQLSVSQRLINSANQIESGLKSSGRVESGALDCSFGDVQIEQVPLDFVLEAGYSAEISTDNSLCPLTGGSIENEDGQNLLDFSREYRTSVSPKEDQIKEEVKLPVRYARRMKIKRKKNANYFIVEAWIILKKLFIKYLYLRKTRALIRQQYRKAQYLATNQFKEFYKILKKSVQSTSRRKIKFCICHRRLSKGFTSHTDMCNINRKVWKIFLDQSIEYNIEHFSRRIKPIKREILLELSIALQNKLRKSKVKFSLERGMF